MKAKVILVATDFSPSANAALECATELAKSVGASLSIVHVEMAPVLKGAYDDENDPEEHRAHLLLDQVKQLDPAVSIKKTLLKGGVASEILDFAREQRVDMIVVGTHGQTNSPHTVMGTVAEAIIRQTPCQFIAVKPAGATP